MSQEPQEPPPSPPPYQQETERPKKDCPKCEEHNTLKKYKAGWACSYCFYHED